MFHTSKSQGDELTTKDKESRKQDGSIKRTALPLHETQHPVSPLSTQVEESMRMISPHEEPIEIEDLTQENQLNEDVYSSESFLQGLNSSQLSPAREHLLYSAWTEAGLLSPQKEESSNPTNIGEIENRFEKQTEEDAETTTKDTEKVVMSNALLKPTEGITAELTMMIRREGNAANTRDQDGAGTSLKTITIAYTLHRTY